MNNVIWAVFLHPNFPTISQEKAKNRTDCPGEQENHFLLIEGFVLNIQEVVTQFSLEVVTI